MSISKLKLGICVAVLGGGIMVVQAEIDTPAQAAARAALMQRMQQADGTTNQPASMAPMSGDTDTPVQAAARAALLKRIHDADTNQAPVMMVNTVPSGSMMTPEQTKVIQAAAAKANAKKAAEEQAQQLAAQKASEQQAQDSAAMAKTAALHASYPGKELGFAPPVVPPSPITPEKQARLDALLIQYKANQISPEEYHKQRAVILDQP